MPVRPRRERHHAHELTLKACLLLTIGPGPLDELDDEEQERLADVWHEHRRWFESRRNRGEQMWGDRFDDEEAA